MATELSQRSTGRVLYILDELTTGLFFENGATLLRVLKGLVDFGSAVIVIEHHPDAIKNADYIIDLVVRAQVTKAVMLSLPGRLRK